MKKIVLLAFVLPLLLCSISFAMGTTPDPKIYVTPEAWALGQIPPQTTHSKVIGVYNLGGAPLKIQNVRTSCGCTTTQISTKEILSRQSATLEVSFFSGSFKGVNTKRVYITSNDPKTPTFTFVLSAEVVSQEAK